MSTSAPQSDSTDSGFVIYIHGIGEHPSPEVWKSQWDLALFGRPMGERTRGAYWADILHESASRTKQLKPVSQSLDPKSILRDAGIKSNNKSANEFVEQLIDTFSSTMGGSSKSIGKKVLPLPESWRRKLAEVFLRKFVKDTAAYFFNAEVRKKIKDRLITQIPPGGEPFILVSHSQGTIVALEVLSEIPASDRAEVELLVTLGSPLGIQEIQDLMRKEEIEQRVPDGVRAWHNFADRFDPVALDAQLANDFEPNGSVVVRDHLIVNKNLSQLRGLNPHDSAGYLSHLDVRSVVHRALKFDTFGRFVVARDVAERFAAFEERQPVLIEALEPNYRALGESDDELRNRENSQDSKQVTLVGRISSLADNVRTVVSKQAEGQDQTAVLEAARIQELRKYVAAHLTPNEIQELATKHADLNIYAMWRSSEKKKLIHRSNRVIGADAARASYRSLGRDIVWAVLDTGCKFDHPHFNADRGLIVDLLDCTTGDPKPVSIKNANKSDIDGHGTHVCGIISGQGEDRGRTYTGVAPEARLLVYKVLNDQGRGEDAWIIKAIDDIFNRNQNSSGIVVHGVNLSLGGPFDATVYGCGFSPICQSLRDLWRQGVLVCVAAGNEGQIEVTTLDGSFDLNTTLSIGDPANLEDCIAVGSVNTDKPYLYGISYFSSRGPTTDGRMKPDIVAPGERIASCNADYPVGSPNQPYREESGTSMACPHVSGLLAAFLSVRREFIGRPDEVKSILLQNCNDLKRDRHHQGFGLPNLHKMLINT